MDMMNESCSRFLAELASKAPTPGGGGTAALVGAAGVALGNMVGCLTVGKKKYAAVEADILTLNERAGALRAELEALVQADAEAFAPLAAAYGLPKNTPEQAAHKAAVLETALDAACAVPLEIMGKCAEGIALVEEYAAKGSALAASAPSLFQNLAYSLQGRPAGRQPERVHQHKADDRQNPCRRTGCAGRRPAERVCPEGGRRVCTGHKAASHLTRRWAGRKLPTRHTALPEMRGIQNGKHPEGRARGGRYERTQRCSV